MKTDTKTLRAVLKRMDAPAPKVAIIVNGGCVMEVFSSLADTEVEIIDCDNADTEEDERATDARIQAIYNDKKSYKLVY